MIRRLCKWTRVCDHAAKARLPIEKAQERQEAGGKSQKAGERGGAGQGICCHARTGAAVCPRPGRPSWTTGQGLCSLLDADDAAIIPSYDVSTAGNAGMRHTLEDVFPPGEDIGADVSLDARVPWWLWLSGGFG